MKLVRSSLVLLVCFFSLVSSAIAAVDDCHPGFSAYAAAQPYIINPAVADRAMSKFVAVFEDTEAISSGAVGYRLVIRNAATDEVVALRRGAVDFAPGRQVEALATWDGRDARGNFVPDGEYEIVVIAQMHAGQRARDARSAIVSERADHIAQSTPIRVVVDRAGVYDALFEENAVAMRQIEAQAAGLDATFPYNFYFGTTHAHTIWSDGGMPTSDCQSGRYGYAGGAQPADAFSYAKTSGGIDFLAVVEHNHLMQDACTSCTAEGIKSRYVSGFNAAQTATSPGTFVGLFGMEWGVISGGGHINIYNQSNLMSWAGEPYHVFTDKSNYPTLYTAMKNNQGTLGSYGAFNHPNSSDFGSWARSADGDAVMRGLSIISGPAFNTSTSFTPGGSTYTGQYNSALSKGWKIAPEAHQDNHCINYGNSTPNRTVAIIPTSSTFNQTSLMSAYGARRFYAAQDRDVQLVYRTSDSTRVMGDSFSASAGVSVYARLLDPAGEGVQKIEIWGGKAGTVAAPGAAPTVVASNTSATSLTATLPVKTSGETWFYYITAVQADGNTVWSAPMWITWGGTSCTLPGSTSLTAPASGATGVSTAPTLSWGAASSATSYDLYFGTASTPPFSVNTTSTSRAMSALAANTTYYWRVVAKNTCGSGSSSPTWSFTTAGGTQQPVTIFNEGAESGATGWTFTKNAGSGWAIETSTDSRSGAKRFKTNVGYSTYYDGADWSVVSPQFSLAGRTSATLTFYNKYKTESGYDYSRVEVSTNGGTSWTSLRSVSGTSSGYPAWSQVTLNLSPYVGGSTVKLRFRLTTDSSVADWGVAIDDIVVTAQ